MHEKALAPLRALAGLRHSAGPTSTVGSADIDGVILTKLDGDTRGGAALDRIFETEYDHMKDCIESKVFGIGLESYTVGSNDFYIGYGASRGKIVTLDTGHFHPTEIVADKISSLLLFIPEVMLHVSRPVRW